MDTIREFLHSHDRKIAHIVYPLMKVERDEHGSITDLHPPGEQSRTESMVYAEVSRVEDPEMLDNLRDETRRRLDDVVKATDDFGLMVDKIGDVVSELSFRMRDLRASRAEFREIQAFLRWLRDGGFVFLGYRYYTFAPTKRGGEPAVMVEPGSGLGILQNEGASTFARPVPMSDLPAGMRERAAVGPAPDHQQDQRRIHRSPPRADGLRRRQEAARRRIGGRRAPLPGALHLAGILGARAGHSPFCAGSWTPSSNVRGSPRDRTTTRR